MEVLRILIKKNDSSSSKNVPKKAKTLMHGNCPKESDQLDDDESSTKVHGSISVTYNGHDFYIYERSPTEADVVPLDGFSPAVVTINAGDGFFIDVDLDDEHMEEFCEGSTDWYIPMPTTDGLFETEFRGPRGSVTIQYVAYCSALSARFQMKLETPSAAADNKLVYGCISITNDIIRDRGKSIIFERKKRESAMENFCKEINVYRTFLNLNPHENATMSYQ